MSAITEKLLTACKAAYHCHVFDFQQGVGVSELEQKMLDVRDQLEEAIREAEEAVKIKPDWRIGLTVKPKNRNDPLYYERARVVSVHESGFGGIVDLNGVLMLQLAGGSVILARSEDWMTA